MPDKDNAVNSTVKNRTVGITAVGILIIAVILVFGTMWMGRSASKDTEDAVRMLKGLSGRTHEVYTGVTIFPVDPETQQSYTFSSCTKVTFYPLSEAEIRDYVASGEPMDKAGAYGIQGLGERLVERIEGDYNNVVGFPLSAFMRILAQKGMISYD